MANHKEPKWALVETLPKLSHAEVKAIIKFMYANAGALEELHSFESCCASDDGPVYQGYLTDALKIGYGIQTFKEWQEDNLGDYDEEDDEDDDE